MKNRTFPLRTFLSMRNLFYPFFAIIVYLLTVSAPVPAADSEKVLPEYRIRAAFIYNFLKFVTWPETRSPKNGANVCIIGDAGFAS